MSFDCVYGALMGDYGIPLGSNSANAAIPAAVNMQQPGSFSHRSCTKQNILKKKA